jgi:hypothetical protein
MTGLVRMSKVNDIYWIADKMRKADRDEIKAVSGDDPSNVLASGIEYSRVCITFEYAGAPIAMCGVVGEFGGMGIIWMLGTDEINNAAKEFMRLSRQYLKRILCLYPLLTNYVDDRNIKAIAWLKKLGATIYDPEKYGIENMLFRRFEFKGVSCATH